MPPLPISRKNRKIDLTWVLVHFRMIFRKILSLPIIPDLPPKNFWKFQPPRCPQSKMRLIFSEITPKSAFWLLYFQKRKKISKNLKLKKMARWRLWAFDVKLQWKTCTTNLKKLKKHLQRTDGCLLKYQFILKLKRFPKNLKKSQPLKATKFWASMAICSRK